MPTGLFASVLRVPFRDATGQVLVVCSSALVLGTVLQSSLFPRLPHIAEEQHLSPGVLALVAGASSVGIFVAAVPAGLLVARYGARAVLAAAAALLALSALVLVVDEGAAGLISSRLAQGVAGSMSWGAAFPWVADVAPVPRRARMLGTLIGAGTVGGLVGPVVPLVGEAVGFGPVYAAIAMASCVVCVACLRLPTPRREAAASPGETGRSSYGVVLAGGWLVVLAGVVVGLNQVLGALRLDHVGASAAQIAGVLVLATLGQTLLGPVAGSITDRYGAAWPITSGLLLMAVVLLAYTAPTTTVVQAAVVLLCMYATTVMWGPAVALMSAAARAAGMTQGAVFALANLAWATGTFVGTGGGGAAGRSGHESILVTAIACLVMATAGGIAVTRRRRRAVVRLWST
jgi:MFS family permease